MRAGVLCYFHTYVGADHLGVVKISSCNNYLGGGGVRKMNILGGYEDFVDLF